MDTTQRNEIMQRWRVVLQHELLPELVLSLKLEQVVHTLDWVGNNAYCLVQDFL